MVRNVRPPLTELRKSIQSEIIVRLKDGKEYKGRLEHLDDHMNLVLTGCVELDGDGNPLKRVGDMFLRGNNIMFIVIRS